MVMEALEGYSERIKYDIVGHSGEDNDIPFVPILKAPENDMERLKVDIKKRLITLTDRYFQVLKEMHAHSQFCMSGDHTLSSR